ncbi:MAG: hypothetical protein IJ781_05940 [Atopobiaceae bacterium]|nr:hypothetical protein [Atopobiaceae bacterium]
MNEVEKIEAQIAALDERRGALDARLKKARAKAEAEDLKGRKVAEVAIGKAVIDLLGDWKTIEPNDLTVWLAEHVEDAREACVVDELDVKAALGRYRGPKRTTSRTSSTAKADDQGEPIAEATRQGLTLP